jgi:hypothetical protein
VITKERRNGERSETGRGEDGKLGDGDKKGKDGSQDGGMGEGDAIFAAQPRGVRRTEQTRFRWQSECFREDETDKKQILNKGFKNETLQSVKQELLKLNSAVQQQGKKRRTIGEQQKRV